MSILKRMLGGLALSVVLAGCSSDNGTSGNYTTMPNGPAVAPANPETVKTCDVVRARLRRSAFAMYGVYEMASIARKISAEISVEDVQDLARVAPAMASYGVPDEVKRQAKEIAVEIYQRAMDRTGIPRGIQVEKIPVSGRTVIMSPGWYSFDPNAFSLAETSVFAEMGSPRIGSIGEVYLATNPEQTRYKVILVKYVQQVVSNGQTSTIGNFIDLATYVESQVPKYCIGIPTEVRAEDFDTIPGPGITR
jgi:hypothetical protein